VPKYLLRRRNRMGQYVHLGTYEWEPNDNEIEGWFGPGQYTILMADEGQRGLKKVRDVTVQWKIEFINWKDGRWTKDDIDKVAEKWGAGNFFEISGCKVHTWQRYPTQELPKLTWEFLQDGVVAMKNISVLFKVEMPWIT